VSSSVPGDTAALANAEQDLCIFLHKPNLLNPISRALSGRASLVASQRLQKPARLGLPP